MEELAEAELLILGWHKIACSICRGGKCIDCRNRGYVLVPPVNEFGTVTGRFSSSQPNIQNIPRYR